MSSFEEYIETELDKLIDSEIKEAMKYAMAGGKRFRPNLTFAVLEDFGKDIEYAYPYAFGLEMIQSYSLVHDDLPCMDNDDMRRGQPSTWAKYGETYGLLAGDGLLTHAFYAAVNGTAPALTQVKIIKELALAAGSSGMIYGQYLDLENDKNNNATKDVLDKIQDYKTGCLFRASLRLGMYLVNDEENIAFYDEVATKIGRIFQMQDDLFDVTRSTEEMGKPSGSDEKNNKLTILNYYSIDELKELLDKEFKDLYTLIDSRNFKNNSLRKIIEKMERR